MKTQFKILLVLIVVVFASCKDLTEMNVNPNGVDPSTVNPNLLVPTVIVATAQPYLSNGYNGNVAGVMQYVQKSGWSSGLNNFDWVNEVSWSGYYGNLRNIKQLYDRSMDEGMEFQQGLALVLRAFNFGIITDSWGDAPYTAALNAPIGAQEDLFPVFDSQETIYKGIIEDLKMANTLLSKTNDAYIGISQDADVMYNGSPLKWRKLANSLMLRYYMRVSTKLPDYAKSGIEEIISNAGTYPVFTGNEDDATMDYVGTSNSDSWPANTTYDNSQSNFSRIQLCAGFRDVLVDFNDPRLAVWFKKTKVPIKISTKYDPEVDIKVDGVRYLLPSYVASQGYVVYNKNTWQAASADGKTIIDTMDYAAIPTAVVGYEPYNYNLNPKPTQGGYNDHISALADMYKNATGDLQKARLISYAEVCFILAEAAKKGWTVGSQQTWYEKGVKASLETWGVGGDYSSYISGSGVAYDGSQEQIMTQKWIGNWTNATESGCDWRRTGLPDLKFGARGKRDAMPLRLRYDANEKNRNSANYSDAISKLVETPFTSQDGKDSSWSKFWLLQ
ncbi:MAG: SusD/RagB family nutrient-binding outer membrane lipoprotein [Draconibacterium sp.]|nr:SusD/RagB family nutrient-binding outer membrane lipoprotein [Draconibacterium sp.]